MKLLLIDDNKIDMGIFCDELRLEGHIVLQATDHQALKSICDKLEQIDGIILDLMFPPNNNIPLQESDFGYRGGQLLYDNLVYLTYPNVPFVILTAMDSSINIYHAIIVEMKKYKSFKGSFHKPVDVCDIVQALLK